MRRLVRNASMIAAAALSVACMQKPDLSAVETERAKAVLRSDTFQSVASNGRVLVAGTANGVLVTSSDGGRNWARQTL